MATWAIGDIQGCYDEFAELLDVVRFEPAHDRLWLVGDLVNRGPRSLDVLRRVRALGPAALTVLGNHDLHLLAIHFGGHKANRGDTFGDVLAAPDRDELCDWLRRQPLLVSDDALGHVMTHAGIPHIWTRREAQAHAREVEAVLGGTDHVDYFRALYGNRPSRWDDGLAGMDRWRLITNYFTRMRLVDVDGGLDFAYKGPVVHAPEGWLPWYELRARRPLRETLLFGHWASLEGHTGRAGIVALDTGCVWGRTLTAYRLEDGTVHRVVSRLPRATAGD
ncbi:MAG: symmetrical bis(5'-nucleosyl)-tetraphosphatase [Pseudomonadales bacterium]|nr:symmetrical bis(5'-nucleosyl)-tetraphosphatase [Pseudomonadales bacterium]